MSKFEVPSIISVTSPRKCKYWLKKAKEEEDWEEHAPYKGMKKRGKIVFLAIDISYQLLKKEDQARGLGGPCTL